MAARQVKSQKTKAKSTSQKPRAEDSLISSVSSLKLPNLANRFSKRTRNIVLGVIAVGLLLFLAGRYLVIAWVDNKPITRFEYYSALEKKFGSDTRENLIVEKLFISEASKRNINVSAQEVNDEIAKIETQQGGAEQLNQALIANNLSRDELFSRIRLELIKQKMFGQGISISDEDIRKYIEENKEGLPASLTEPDGSSESAKMRDNLKEQLKQQKVDEEFNKWLTEALKSSRVVRI